MKKTGISALSVFVLALLCRLIISLLSVHLNWMFVLYLEMVFRCAAWTAGILSASWMICGINSVLEKVFLSRQAASEKN